jgi:hypothetical protein
MQFPDRECAPTYCVTIRYGYSTHLGDETCIQWFLGSPVSGAANGVATMLAFLPHLCTELPLSGSCTRMPGPRFVSASLPARAGRHCHRPRDENGTRLSARPTASPHSVSPPSHWFSGSCSFAEELTKEVGNSQWLKSQENRSVGFGKRRGLIQLESHWLCRPGSLLTSDSHPLSPPSLDSRSSPQENKNQNRNSHRVISQEHRWVSSR